MTFTDLVDQICERLNLTSTDARNRVGRNINDRYRRLTSSIGLETTRRGQVSAQSVIGNQTMTFQKVEKLLNVIDKSVSPEVVLALRTPDEMNESPIRTDPPRYYSIERHHANTVDIRLDSIPETVFTLYADGMLNLLTLAENDEPDFPESYHDILIYGVMCDEYRKMEKGQFAQVAESDYEKRLSDLRMWMATSAYKDIYQSKDGQMGRRWLSQTTRWGY